jgi:hypothetical protein
MSERWAYRFVAFGGILALMVFGGELVSVIHFVLKFW